MGYTHGTKWTDEKIENEILKVVEKLNIDHFPTHSEMKTATKSNSLACIISKRQGSAFWAKKLDLKLDYSETTFGNKYEVIAINDIFENTGLHSVQTSSRHPYDLLTDNSVKIDIKVSKTFTNNCGFKSYSFNLEKREPTCDFYILYCLHDDESYHKILVIPSCSLLGQTQIGVGMNNSKWDFYKNKWEYIIQYSVFFKKYQFSIIEV